MEHKNKNDERMERLGSIAWLGQIVLPFGKYSGKPLGQIPLDYLDQTISTMPDTYLIRAVKRFVDAVMLSLYPRQEYDFLDTGHIPKKSWKELAAEEPR